MKISEKGILTGMVLAYVFHNLFVFDNLISYIIFFSIISYVHWYSTADNKTVGNYYTKTFSDEVTNYVILPIVTVLTIGMVYFVNIPALSANQTLIQAISPQKEGVEKNLSLFNQTFSYDSFGSTEAIEQLVTVTNQIMSSQFPAEIKQKFIDLTKKKIEEKVAQVPKDARYLVFAGSFFNRLGQYDEAIKYLERALVESPKKQTIYFELGTSYMVKGDYKKMMELFKTAYDFKPGAQDAQVMYAVGAIYAKDNTVLTELLPKINQEVVISDNRFLKAYADTGSYNSVITILSLRLQKDPTNTQNKLSLASTYATIGQKQKAIDILREMIAADPKFKDQGEQYIKEVEKS